MLLYNALIQHHLANIITSRQIHPITVCILHRMVPSRDNSLKRDAGKSNFWMPAGSTCQLQTPAAHILPIIVSVRTGIGLEAQFKNKRRQETASASKACVPQWCCLKQQLHLWRGVAYATSDTWHPANHTIIHGSPVFEHFQNTVSSGT